VTSGEPSSGIVQVSGPMSSGKAAFSRGPITGRDILITQNPITVTFRAKILSIANDQVIVFGLIANNDLTLPGNPATAVKSGYFFVYAPPYTSDSNIWVRGRSATNATLTSDQAIVTGDANWHDFKIAITTAGGAVFTVDGANTKTIAYSANSTVPLSIGILTSCYSIAGTLLVDFIRFQQTLSR
jgi:hypothetical protein